MKIAVLFGSFNPMTNAHVSVMKAAMKGIGAQKGLFVCTNGKYLKRKAVKIISGSSRLTACFTLII